MQTEYSHSRGFTEDDRPYPQPEIYLKGRGLISSDEAEQIFSESRQLLQGMVKTGKINRVIAEKGKKRFTYYYLSELSNVLKKC